MKRTKTNRIIVHHSVSPTTTTVEQIDRWHRDRGYEGIGYHYLITGDGISHIGRPLADRGAHCSQANSDSIGICLAGDNTREAHQWTEEQVRCLLALVDNLRFFYGSLELVGHRDVPGARTECPGVDLTSYLAAFKKDHNIE